MTNRDEDMKTRRHEATRLYDLVTTALEGEWGLFVGKPVLDTSGQLEIAKS